MLKFTQPQEKPLKKKAPFGDLFFKPSPSR